MQSIKFYQILFMALFQCIRKDTDVREFSVKSNIYLWYLLKTAYFYILLNANDFFPVICFQADLFLYMYKNCTPSRRAGNLLYTIWLYLDQVPYNVSYYFCGNYEKLEVNIITVTWFWWSIDKVSRKLHESYKYMYNLQCCMKWNVSLNFKV